MTNPDLPTNFTLPPYVYSIPREIGPRTDQNWAPTIGYVEEEAVCMRKNSPISPRIVCKCLY